MWSFLGQLSCFFPARADGEDIEQGGGGGGPRLILDLITLSHTVHDSQERR